jgi:ADP-ribose pyrophosphatase YjhB (NUDIX family)
MSGPDEMSAAGAPGSGPGAVDPAEQVRRAVIAMTALSQSGLQYAVNEYDVDRYRKLGSLAADLLSSVTDRPAVHWELELGRDAGYATPKVDVRGAVVDADERILLMRERSDGLWSLPGGWADPLDTPSRAVEREIAEETGYGARAVKLVGCWDRDTQGHLPKLPFSIYKLFFLCVATGDVRPPDALETLEIGWFGVDDLPVLSAGRISARQLDPLLPTEFD